MPTFRRRALRAARAFLPGMLVTLPAAAAVWEACLRASWATLGRDHGIFQYIAWAIARGDVLYRDVRDVNGPLVAMLHSIAMAFGGGDEHRFRVLDLSITALVAAFSGACLASLEDRRSGRTERVLRGLSLGAAASTVLSAQYVAYGFWDTAQRESFFDWFVLTSVGLQMVAQSRLRLHTLTPNKRRIGITLLVFSGAASVVPWFGKPTFVLFTIGQAAALALDDIVLPRLRRLVVLALGGVIGAVGPVAFLLLYADVRAWARISLVDVPAMYRFIWPRSFMEILHLPGHGSTATLAALASGASVALVAMKVMPRRALLLLVMPIAGLASVAIQGKGFLYHFHPVSAGTALVFVAMVHQAWMRAERHGATWMTLGASAITIALGVWAARLADRELYPPAPTMRDAASLTSEERLKQYERVDFFPKGLRDAAAHLADNTRASETVQTYGMDPYVLFLAQRRSATPYIYAYDLDADAALAGGFGRGARPTAEQARVITSMRDAHERDLLERMKSAPPAAFVLHDRSPLLRWAHAERDFEEHCPATYAWVRSRYAESASFDGVHVWLRMN